MRKGMVLGLVSLLILVNTAFAQKMTVRDSDMNVLMEVNDEGTMGSIVLPDTNVALDSETNKLYNLNGSLIWNGTALGTAVSGWNDVGTQVVLVTSSDQVGIGTGAPHASSILEILSTTQGLLIPRMTAAQRDVIINPATGLFLFNTETLKLNYFHGDEWYEITGVPVSDPPLTDCENQGGSTYAGAVNLGNISGTSELDHIVEYGCGACWFKVYLIDNNGIFDHTDLCMKVTLQPPSGMNYDLCLYNDEEIELDHSYNIGSMMEEVSITISDEGGEDDSQYIFIEITLISGTLGTNWSLNVYGNTL